MKQVFKTRIEWILLAAVLIAHLVLLSTQMNRAEGTPLLRAWTMELAYPFLTQAVGSVTSVSNVWHKYVDLRRTREENAALKGELERYRHAITGYEEKIKEISRLQVLSELEASLPFPSVKARVIGGDPTQWYQSRILDKGREAGLERDCPAINADGIVGRIVQVSRHSSVLQLITDVDSGVGVLLESSRAQGVLKGEGRHEAFIDYVGSSEKVVIGEKVLTSGLDQIYPKGLLVGHVVAKEPSKQVFQKVDVVISANVLKLEEVLVLKKRESPG
jgi:rod shape-determining protein MreC